MSAEILTLRAETETLNDAEILESIAEGSDILAEGMKRLREQLEGFAEQAADRPPIVRKIIADARARMETHGEHWRLEAAMARAGANVIRKDQAAGR